MQKFKRGEIVEIPIHDMAFGGKGISKIETEEGKFVLFTPNTIPGQTVKARIVKSKSKYAECKLDEVLIRSEQEQENDFQPISGAPYATLPIEKQKYYKQKTAIELFKRIGNIANAEEVFDEYILSPEIWHYRNKMEYAFCEIRYDLEKQREEDDFGLGFKHRGTWWAVENLDKDSGLFDKEVEDNLHLIRKFCEASGLKAWHAPKSEGFFRFLAVRKSYFSNQLLFNLVTSSDGLENFDMQGLMALFQKLFGERLAGILHTINDETGDRTQPTAGSSRLVYGEGKIVEKILSLKFEISMQSFFQTNPRCAELLYQKTIDYVLEDLNPKKVILDLFCGTGTISQLLAGKIENAQIAGVDIVPEAIEDAKENAIRNGIENVEFYAEDVGKFINQHPEFNDKIGTIVLDPPRAGIAPKSLQKVIALSADNIVYVSCNPATLARDIKTLNASGYDLKKYSLVDQFPHTSHIEAIALLNKKS